MDTRTGWTRDPRSTPRRDDGEPRDRCVICRRPIEPGDSVVFTERGMAHVECYVDRRRPAGQMFDAAG
ncbi:MAG TPA: hypothetical protein VNN07_10550 [Candidatus Tectomicrobia bacterium]|nr:hypothetical protein [Candidatus Tectomicrobia bacterium]